MLKLLPVQTGHRAMLLNPYTLYSEGLAEKINNFYIKLVQKAPTAFGAVYSAGQLYRRLPVHSPVYYRNGKEPKEDRSPL